MLHTRGSASLQRYSFAKYLGKRLHGCPCGYFDDAARQCTWSMTLVSRDQKRLSGPLLDCTPAHAALAQVSTSTSRRRAAGLTAHDFPCKLIVVQLDYGRSIWSS